MGDRVVTPAASGARPTQPGASVGAMGVVIAGGHGKIALRLERLLALTAVRAPGTSGVAR